MKTNFLLLICLIISFAGHAQFLQTGSYCSLNPQKGLQSYDQLYNKTLTIEPDSTFHFSFNYRGGWGRLSGTFNAGRWKMNKDTLLLQFYFTSMHEMLTAKYLVKDDRLIVMNEAELPTLHITDDFRLDRIKKVEMLFLNNQSCFSAGIDPGCRMAVWIKSYHTVKKIHQLF